MAINLGDLASKAKAAVTGDTGPVNANTRNEMFKKICGLIPNKVSNATVLEAFELMRKEQKLLRKSFSHQTTNETAFKKHAAKITTAKGYIEDQSAWTDVAYGDSTMQYSGCEIFATFNAFYNLTGKVPVPLAKMIADYEQDGMVLSGKFGTAPKAIVDYITKQGYKASITTEESEFDTYGKNYDSFILTMYNDGSDISQEVHTVCISKENGKFTGHNVYCNGTVVGPYDSVTAVIKNINKGKAKGISLIGIKKK